MHKFDVRKIGQKWYVVDAKTHRPIGQGYPNSHAASRSITFQVKGNYDGEREKAQEMDAERRS